MAFPAPMLHDRGCGWYLDLRSHIMFSRDKLEGSDIARGFWKAAYLHETAHWMRYQSSTIGLLLTLLQRAKAITAMRAISELPRLLRVDLIRRLRSGTPVWSTERGFDPNHLGEDFALMGQSWLDLQVVFTLLFDANGIDGIAWQYDEALGCALSDAWRAAASFPGMLPHPGNAVADHLCRDFPKLSPQTGRTITTRSLWECASTLDELRTNGLTADDQSQLAELVRYKLDEPEYGAPWAWANGQCVGGTTPDMFQLVVHLAMNPPLPFWDPAVTAMSWEDLYPPARFARLYRTVAENSFLHETVVSSRVPAGLLEEIASLSSVPVGRVPGVPDFDVSLHPAVAQPTTGGHNAVVKNALTLSHLLDESPLEAVWPTIESVHVHDGEDWGKWLATMQSRTRFAAPILMSFADGHYSAGLVEPVLSDVDMASFVRGAWGFGVLDELIQGRPSAAAEQLFIPRDLRIETSVEKFIDRYVSEPGAPWW